MSLINVLYIEDNDQEALIMELGLRRFDIRVQHIPHITAETLYTLRQPPYDEAVAVLFDEMLAGESGAALAQALRDSSDSRLIFLLTAGDNPDPTALTTQSILFRRKPVDFQELAATIRRLSDG
jgi:DNA-binding response OmpR family regulator